MGVQVLIFADFVNQPQEVMEKLLIAAVIETLQVFLNLWHFDQSHNNLRRINNFFLNA
jgi:hypothetical protein